MNTNIQNSEEWKKIAGYPNYSVSSIGRVRNDKTNKLLRPGRQSNGYLTVALCHDGKQRSHLVHRLVAVAFLPNERSKPQVNHKNGARDDSRLENLEWTTQSENTLHSCHTLGRKPSNEHMDYMRHLSNQAHKKPVICLETGIVYESVTHAAKEFGVVQQTISNALTGYRKSAVGFHWKYLNEGEDDSEDSNE